MTRCATIPSFRRLRPSMLDRKSTRLNSSHVKISYAVFCLKKKKGIDRRAAPPTAPRRATPNPTPCTSRDRVSLAPRLTVQTLCSYLSPESCFFFNDAATTEIYTLSLHDALPI